MLEFGSEKRHFNRITKKKKNYPVMSAIVIAASPPCRCGLKCNTAVILGRTGFCNHISQSERRPETGHKTPPALLNNSQAGQILQQAALS